MGVKCEVSDVRCISQMCDGFGEVNFQIYFNAYAVQKKDHFFFQRHVAFTVKHLKCNWRDEVINVLVRAPLRSDGTVATSGGE